MLFAFRALIGCLVARSTFLARTIGALLVVAALCYMINSVNNLLLPLPFPLFPYILLPAMVAELGLALWLVVAGVNESRWREQASATVGEN